MADTGGQSKRSPRKKSPAKQTEAEQVSGFLRSIGYRKKDDDSSYGNALEVLKTIFEATGQQNLLELVKLRRLWFGEIGGFLASHVQPSRITVEQHFEVDGTFLENLRLDGPSQDLMEISADLVGRVYSKWRDFQSALRRRLGRPLEKQEIQLLRKHSKFVPDHAVLHLTVYDGSIAQAIQFEEQAYLQRFRELLPELPLGAIRCKVGDLGRTSHDQRGLEEMLSRWEELKPRQIFENCLPDHIHRVNEGHAVLILNCSTASEAQKLRLHPGGQGVLKKIHEGFPDLEDLFQQVAFISSSSTSPLKPGIDVQEPSQDSSKSRPQLKHGKKIKDPASSGSEKERVLEIIEKLRESGKQPKDEG